jgi:hypothetical protein
MIQKVSAAYSSGRASISTSGTSSTPDAIAFHQSHHSQQTDLSRKLAPPPEPSLYPGTREVIKQENQKVMREWDDMCTVWKRIYYCARDDCVFDPINGNYAPIEKMHRIYETQVDTQNETPSNQDEAISLAIKKYYLLQHEFWLRHPAIAEVKKHLTSDELPEGVIFVQHPDTVFGGGGLWATNKRLLYVGLTLLKKPMVIEYPYSQVSSIDCVGDKSLVNGKLILQHGNRQVILKNVNTFARASDFIRFVRSRLT